MKIISAAPDTMQTYQLFGREVRRFVTRAKMENLAEAQLSAALNAALHG